METKKKLKVAYYVDDGFVKASPACARGVMESVEALREQGHECIEWCPPDGKTIFFFSAHHAFNI